MFFKKWSFLLMALFSCWGVNAFTELAFEEKHAFRGQDGVLVGCPSNTTLVELETTETITVDSWQKTGVQRLSDYDNETGFLRSLMSSSSVSYARCIATTNNSLSERRMRMLHNGHFLTVSPRAAVSRCPVEPDPGHWLDQHGDVPDYYPPDYLVGEVYMPLGLTTGPVNRMQLTVEQALTAMTFWSAYNAGLEYEQGAIASPWTAPGYDGWFADFVIWENNPLAIQSDEGYTLQQLGQYYGLLTDEQQKNIVNQWIAKFRPSMTVIGGIPAYVSTNGIGLWAGQRE